MSAAGMGAQDARSRRLLVARMASLAVWAALGAAVTVGAIVLAPLALDLRPYTVMSGSMEPAIATGDVVLAASIPPRRARVGDVVTFHDPSRGQRLITHRVRSIRIASGVADFVTRGDANEAPERWTVPADGRIGRVVYKVPRLGTLAVPVGTPWGRILLVVVPALVLGGAELWRLWRPAQS